MRVIPLGVVLLAACQSTGPAEAETQVVEASVHRSQSAPAASTRLLDAASLALAHAVLATTEHRRRVALENLANAQVPGWKRRIAVLQGQMAFPIDGQVFQAPTVFDVLRDHAQGALDPTRRSFDVAIDGDGFFAVTNLDGSTGFTRNGALRLNAEGKLVTLEGLVVLPEITSPSDTLEFCIGADGAVSGRTAGSPDTHTLFGQLTLHRFVNAPGLRVDGGVFGGSEAAGQPITGTPGSNGLGLLRQGMLERSNVAIANELLELKAIEQQHAAFATALAPYGIPLP